MVLAVWVALYFLHVGNDGLWSGDSARHAANGLFWRDYLTEFTLHAKAYALSHYARYPLIKPSACPPLFYLLEAALFSITGPSAHTAKALVLAFALAASLYTMAWLRRWVSPKVG